MTLIGRRRCGCECQRGFDDPYVRPSGTGTGGAIGPGYPVEFCPSCEDGPCWYDVDWNCHISCNGFEAGEGVKYPDYYGNPSTVDYTTNEYKGNVNVGPLRSRKLSRLYKDRCPYDNESVYSSRVTTSGVPPDLPRVGNLIGDVPGAGVSSIGSLGSGLSVTHPQCGWYHDTHISCPHTTEYVDWLEDRTRVVQELEITGATAVLRCYSDSGLIGTYETTSWIDSTPSFWARNELRLTVYPNAACPYLPEYICVWPGDYRYSSRCATVTEKEECCFPEDVEMCFIGNYGTDDCQLYGVQTRQIHFSKGQTPTLWDRDPDTGDITLGATVSGVTPSGSMSSCGYFWGYTEIQCDTGTGSGPASSFAIGLLTWCESGVWKQSVYCAPGFASGNHSFSLLCTATNGVIDHCCPYLKLSFACDFFQTWTGTGTGTGTGQMCCCVQAPSGVDTPCCPSNSIPNTLHVTMISQTHPSGCSVGTVYTVSYAGIVSGNHQWNGSQVAIRCNASTNKFQMSADIAALCCSGPTGAVWATEIASPNSCSPLLKRFSFPFGDLSAPCPHIAGIMTFELTA